MIKILAIPGSLRTSSSSHHILKAVLDSAPENVKIEVYDGIGLLPHFNDPEDTPAIVADFKEKIRQADAILICTPEYAFGIPGSLKNALDWTVSSADFMNKPVSVITASSQGEKGHAALMLVLSAISAKIVDDASKVISFIRSKIDTSGKVKDISLQDDLSKIVRVLISAIPKNMNIL